MSNRSVEIGVGLFVALGIAALFMLAMQVSNLGGIRSGEGYVVTAGFENIGGLKVRSPVTASGVRVGRVEDIVYDLDTYEAVVKLRIDESFNRFPEDTSASIFTSGLLGEQYIALEPGGSMRNLAAGDHIRMTQSALVLERVIGQFLYNTLSGDDEVTGTGEELDTEVSMDDVDMLPGEPVEQAP